MFIYDAAFLGGVGCLAYAGYQVHPALAWLVGGLSLAAFGILGARKVPKKK